MRVVGTHAGGQQPIWVWWAVNALGMAAMQTPQPFSKTLAHGNLPLPFLRCTLFWAAQSRSAPPPCCPSLSGVRTHQEICWAGDVSTRLLGSLSSSCMLPLQGTALLIGPLQQHLQGQAGWEAG